MIIEYLRPKTLNEALTFLAREQPETYALGGGTFLNRGQEASISVVDLQELGLGKSTSNGNTLLVGATVTLQALLDHDSIPEGVRKALSHEATYNLRQMATVAGTLISANGRSHLATVFLALDAGLEFQALNAKHWQLKLGEWLATADRSKPTPLIIGISIPMKIKLAYEYIARTPEDQPIVSAALSQWPSGRTRLALGGWGAYPLLAMDGPEPGGVIEAARSSYSQAGDDWASSEYRLEMAAVLARRCLEQLAA